jgi:hypothetical protein
MQSCKSLYIPFEVSCHFMCGDMPQLDESQALAPCPGTVRLGLADTVSNTVQKCVIGTQALEASAAIVKHFRVNEDRMTNRCWCYADMSCHPIVTCLLL